MQDNDEGKALVKKWSDKSRKVARKGSNTFLVPHKFTPDLEVRQPEDQIVLSKLTLADFRFLDAWRDSGWDILAACKKLDISTELAEKSYKKVRYFQDEDAKVQALSKVPTANWVAAKHTENIINGGQLNDSQRDSLKETAKIVGAYKPTTSIQVQAHVLQMPQMSPEQAKAAKEFFDKLAEPIQEAQVA